MEDKLKEQLTKKFSEKAYRYFLPYHYIILDAADKGCADAQYQVGEWFFKKGRTKSSSEYLQIATRWFKKAALKAHVPSQVKIAFCYEMGYGVPQIKDEAIKWYRIATGHGSKVSLERYLKLKYDSKIYEEIIKNNMALLIDASKGNRDKQYMLGEWFQSINIFAYKKEAIVWYTKAAKNGYGDAMLKLGECYENLGDIKNALGWYKKAAKSGNKTACLKLATLYLYGTLVEKNVIEALKWYDLAGSIINCIDLRNIGHSYEVGDGISIDKFKAVEYYKKAAEKGDVVAQYKLGVCLEKGCGVSANIYNARNWYAMAASNGYKKAEKCVLRIDSIIKKQRRKKIFKHILISFYLGPILGIIGYLIMTDGLPKFGTHQPVLWENLFPINLIICLVVGFIVVLFIISLIEENK